MIVASLLLILVAVALLVLGLTGGSSALLISSIVASLLAAVVLVVGARQAAARRRTAAPGPDGVPADPEHDPFLPGAPAEVADERRGPRRRRDEPGPAMATSAPADGYADAATASGPAAPQGSASAPDDVHSDFSGSGPISGDEADRDVRRSAEAADDPSSAPGFREDAAAPSAHDPAGPDDREPERRREPDYDHASSVIGAARTAGDDQSWRRDPDAGPPAAPDEFAEPDEDDPADEPLPQAVRPGDAVRMARIDSEVLVVDGRPRYHLADCPHLVGRLTEALPAREAVELGFSPCGLCRPVDRLVAAESAHR